MNDSNFLKEIGRSYIVSAFLPAFIFLLLGYFLFRGFVPEIFLRQISNNKFFHDYQWFLLFLLSLWIAFYLYSANDITVRIFEGYLIPHRLSKRLVDRQRKVWEKYIEKFNRWDKLHKTIIKKKEAGEIVDEDNREQDAINFMEAQAELANLGLKGPLNPNYFMPTRLGNVLRASEIYAYERYAIEEITIWPRLAPVLPVEMSRNLEEKNNHFMFLINSAFMAFFNALMCFFFGAIGMPMLFVPGLINTHAPKLVGFFYVGYDFIHPLGYLVMGLVLSGFGYMLYRIAVNVAEDFSMYVRASFDLYRVNLLRQMNWPPPKTLSDERILWRDITRFIIAGERMGDVKFPDFEFAKPEEKKDIPKNAPPFFE